MLKGIKIDQNKEKIISGAQYQDVLLDQEIKYLKISYTIIMRGAYDLIYNHILFDTI